MFRFSALKFYWRERAHRHSTEPTHAKMAAENMFSSRKEAVNHLKTVVLEASGQGVQIDAKASGKSRVVLRCPSVFELLPGQLKGRASSVIHQYITKKMAGFDCPKLAGEKTGAHQRRRFEAAEKHAYQNNYSSRSPSRQSGHRVRWLPEPLS